MLHRVNSLQHPLVKHIVKLRQNRDYRYDHQSLVIEGIKIVSEVCSQIMPKVLFTYDESFLLKNIQAEKIFLVNETIMKKISGMQSPEGLVAEIAMPKPASLNGMRYVVALDSINDPGNLGTLLRTALALGWQGVFFVGEGCDPFNEKALRAAKGATFRLPLAWGNWEELQKLVVDNQWQPIAADLQGSDLKDLTIPEKVLLVLGNEARGVSENVQRFCQPASISMSKDMESLNVAIAGGIMMYILHGFREVT
jgi:RNA methyltransferase, TrmH family